MAWCLPLKHGQAKEQMESQMDCGSERGARSQASRKGFLEDEASPGADKVNTVDEDQDTGGGGWEERPEAWEESWGGGA